MTAPESFGPIRTCIGCRQRAASSALLRVVAGDDELVVDLRRRLPGRGAWLHPDRACLRLAQRRNAFERALRVRRRLAVAPVAAYLETGD
ncbi:YlxR family protein [Sciscionella marina]|uniref:YlxR family protein n=1 Tax=Sciscionella marina TaxID=508770 RepID=UPI000A0433F4|nr:YlxR family protein [Sciscionella marina]